MLKIVAVLVILSGDGSFTESLNFDSAKDCDAAAAMMNNGQVAVGEWVEKSNVRAEYKKKRRDEKIRYVCLYNAVKKFDAADK